jgi:hypothetical protein
MPDTQADESLMEFVIRVGFPSVIVTPVKAG